MRRQTFAQTILVLVMFGLSLALFLLFAMRGRLWWGILAAIGSYLLLLWLTAPYLAQTEEPSEAIPASKAAPPRMAMSPRPVRDVPQGVWLAELVNQHGEAVHGRAGRYVPQLYYGRLAQGAVVQLLDLQPVENEFGLLVLPVRVLFDPAAEVTDFGTAVWLNLESTSLAPHFRPKVGTFDLDALRVETARLYPYYEQYHPPEQISQPPTFPKGLVTAALGTAVYGHDPKEDSDPFPYLTRLSHGTKLLLLADTVLPNEHNILYALVEVTTTTMPSPADQDALIGWVTLTDTSLADYYDPETDTIYNE